MYGWFGISRRRENQSALPIWRDTSLAQNTPLLIGIRIRHCIECLNKFRWHSCMAIGHFEENDFPVMGTVCNLVQQTSRFKFIGNTRARALAQTNTRRNVAIPFPFIYHSIS